MVCKTALEIVLFPFSSYVIIKKCIFGRAVSILKKYFEILSDMA